jgi:NTE family protein
MEERKIKSGVAVFPAWTFEEVMSKLGKRALVLGGGGATGNAWLIGVISGLVDAGLDVTAADLVVGTSAGATTAVQVIQSSPSQLLADILSARPLEYTAPIVNRGEQVTTPSTSSHMERTNRVIGASRDAADMRRRMGEAARLLDGSTDVSTQHRWRATVAARLSSGHWPQQPLLITAVDAHSGEPVIFNRHSGIELVDAVAASCAGGFAYKIGDRQYIDGGYRSDLNADLAAGYGRVLIIPPLGSKTRKPLDWGLHIGAQVEELGLHGCKVEVIFPDSNSLSAIGIGMNMMDLSARRPSALAGYSQGKAIAGQLTEFWR